jgi:hypothetical protein
MNSPDHRIRLQVLRAAAAVSLAPLVGRAQTQTPKRIRFAHPAPTAHGWHIWAEQFKKVVEEKTGGKLTVQIFPNAQMGNERDTAQAVRVGSIEMGAMRRRRHELGARDVDHRRAVLGNRASSAGTPSTAPSATICASAASTRASC